jgi:hypothetical protein
MPSMSSVPNLKVSDQSRSTKDRSRSNTWSSSEGVLEIDDKEDRDIFVQEFNKLAKKVQRSASSQIIFCRPNEEKLTSGSTGYRLLSQKDTKWSRWIESRLKVRLEAG